MLTCYATFKADTMYPLYVVWMVSPYFVAISMVRYMYIYLVPAGVTHVFALRCSQMKHSIGIEVSPYYVSSLWVEVCVGRGNLKVHSCDGYVYIKILFLKGVEYKAF